MVSVPPLSFDIEAQYLCSGIHIGLSEPLEFYEPKAWSPPVPSRTRLILQSMNTSFILFYDLYDLARLSNEYYYDLEVYNLNRIAERLKIPLRPAWCTRCAQLRTA